MNRIVAAEQIASALGSTGSNWRYEYVDPNDPDRFSISLVNDLGTKLLVQVQRYPYDTDRRDHTRR